ncbi:MAG: PTS sugar transporter subunit IIA [Eubacteriales bacterium]
MLNDKELSILNCLYLWKRPTKIEELASFHKLSPRSIRSYVTRINNDLKFECIALQKGEFHLTDMEFLADYFQNYQVSNYSGAVLVLFMGHKLALENKINLSHFVIDFEVSRTTAKNYLNQVKEQLEEYHLKLDHSSGITLLGKESDKRQMILNLFLQLPQRERIELQLISPLFLPWEEVVSTEVLELFLEKMFSLLDYHVSEHSKAILLCSLRIMLYRLSQDFPLTEIFNKGFLEKSSEYQQTKELFTWLEEETKIPIPLTEALEIINKVMGLHYSNSKEGENLNWFEYDLFISKMIRRFSKACAYNLVGDFQLYESLLNHIKPAMYRIAHQIKLQKFDVDYIRNHSPEEFALTTEILTQLHFFPQDAKGFQDEIALICVYFKQALQRQKEEERKNILLVSNYGYGSSRMMMEKIRQQYHVGEMAWVPSQELKNMDKRNFHLVISTDAKLEIADSIPLLQISPFFHQEDRQLLSAHLFPREPEEMSLSRLLDIIEKNCEIKDDTQLKEDLRKEFSLLDDTEEERGILDFMTEDMILLEDSSKTIQEVLGKTGKLLEAQGCTQSTYTQNMVESFDNYGIYMMIDENVAIPHTKNTGNVEKTGFTFLRLAQPIAFEDRELSMFFTFCTRNNKEHLEALILIADIIKDPVAKKSMETLESPKEILAFLAKKEKK